MSDKIDSIRDSYDSGEREIEIRSILNECLRRRAEGDAVSDQTIIASHPELMPELGEALRKLRIIGAARDNMMALSDGMGEPTIEQRPSRKDSRGLHIRCPHCSNFVEVVADTPYEEISCNTCGSTFSLIDRDESTRMATPLKSIGRFDLVTRLGVGGFGTVWKARDRELDRTVALKIPRRGQLAPSEIDQFFREARAAAQLQHPNIVPVHEVGRDEDTLYIVSDLVRGVTLSDWLTGNPVSAKEVAELCLPIADALHHAHEQGVVHRDLKPSNIMIDETGRPLVTDFGLAKREAGEITMTVEGQILGTPGYMSPEQARGQGHSADRRTDIYSFGVILFQLLTGELPFRGNAQMQIHQRLTEDVVDPRTLNRHIHRDLSTICLKCLEREPGRRFSTSAQLAEELQRFVRGEPIESRPISRIEKVLRWAKRKPALAAATILTALLAIAGPAVALTIEGQRRRLDDLNLENRHVIEQQANQHQSDANQIKELRDALDLWEDRGNPWELWPPTPVETPRKILMQGIVQQSGRLMSSWSQGNKDEQQAFAKLSLGILNDSIGRANDAIDHYQSARQLLTSLVAQHPNDRQFALALADCSLQLARLRVENERDKARRYIEQARAIIGKLAQENDDPRLQAALLEVELDAVSVPASAGAPPNLANAQKVRRAFEGKIPNDPAELYKLACYLAGREPILITRRDNNTEKNTE